MPRFRVTRVRPSRRGSLHPCTPVPSPGRPEWSQISQGRGRSVGIAAPELQLGDPGRGGGRGHAPPHWCSRPAGATRRGEGPLRREQPPPPPRSRGREQWGAGGGAAGRLEGLCPAVPGVPGEEQAPDPRLSPAVTRAQLERVPRPRPHATGGCGVGCRDAGCGDAGFGEGTRILLSNNVFNIPTIVVHLKSFHCFPKSTVASLFSWGGRAAPLTHVALHPENKLGVLRLFRLRHLRANPPEGSRQGR